MNSKFQVQNSKLEEVILNFEFEIFNFELYLDARSGKQAY